MDGSHKIINKMSRTADKGWFSSLGTRRGANGFSPYKIYTLQTSGELL